MGEICSTYGANRKRIEAVMVRKSLLEIKFRLQDGINESLV
jgi:hypothetical protein